MWISRILLLVPSVFFVATGKFTRWKLAYEEYRNLAAWEIIENELKELVDNQDLVITTLPDLVIGSLVKSLKDNDLLKEDGAQNNE